MVVRRIRRAGVTVPLVVSAGLAAKIFEQAVSVARFDFPCNSKKKGIADIGVKVLSYRGVDGGGGAVLITTRKALQFNYLRPEFQSMGFHDG